MAICAPFPKDNECPSEWVSEREDERTSEQTMDCADEQVAHYFNEAETGTNAVFVVVGR